jgi:hypothetical protein
MQFAIAFVSLDSDAKAGGDRDFDCRRQMQAAPPARIQFIAKLED